VVVQVRLAVSIQSVRERHHTFPSRSTLHVVTPSSIANHEGMLFEIRHRGAHRGAMSVDDTASALRINGEQDGERTWGGDDDVIALHVRPLARDQDAFHGTRVACVALSAQPPTWTARTHAVEFVGRVFGEVRHVVRSMRK
jgi:hypothetical protein